MAEKFPYELCRLVHHDYDLSKRWYVIFRAWDVYLERVRRVRISDPMNKEKTVAGRLRLAEEIMRKTDEDLRSGKVLGKDKLKPVAASDNLHLKTLLQCIDLFVQKKSAAKRRENYLKRFRRNLKNHLLKFYAASGIDDINIRMVDASFLESFFDYLRPHVAPKTFNNMRGDLVTVLKFVNKLKPDLIKNNPWDRIDKMRVVAKKHAAFSNDQVKAIIAEALDRGHRDLALFCQIMYYTLARPAEIMCMHVRDFDMTNDRIIFPGDEAKNWRDEYVTIGDRFRTIIEKSGILDRDPESYVFFYVKQGMQHLRSKKYFYKPLRKILKALELYKVNPNYSLYSFKHSGAVALYLSIKDIWAVKEQCRHNNIAQTEHYLRDLGLLRKEDPVKNFVGAA